MLTLLEEKHNAILALYEQHYGTLLEIRNTLYNNVLPALVRELHLEDETVEWLKMWIADQGSIFRMLKKHKFDPGKTIEFSTYTLRWRVQERQILQSHLERDSIQKCIRSLPIKTRDIFGRPAVVIKPSVIQNNISEVKREIVCVYEKVRQQMAFRHDFQESGCVQFVMIIDTKNVSLSSSILGVISWFVREVAPRFPGMCAAAFVINYTKSYGLHNFVKRLLPANARARIYFPDPSELNSCFSCPLHFDTHGNFDVPEDLANMNAGQPPVAEEECLKIISASSNSSITSGNLSQCLSSMSVFNPYFGYPVISIPGSSAPLLRNGRRRKRDLARTLIRLWLVKLKRLTDKTWPWILVTFVLWGVGLMDNYKQVYFAIDYSEFMSE